MISMCDKIVTYQLSNCENQLLYIHKNLDINSDNFLNSIYIKDFEIVWMDNYILRSDTMENIIKKSFSEDRCILGKVLPLETPFTILIDTSDVCNFKCNYCFRSFSNDADVGDYRKNRLMEWDTFIKIVEQMKEFPQQFKRISLSHQGEPLCNKLIPRMVTYLKEQGFTGSTEFHTNASLLNPQLIKELTDAKIDRIVISLQGINKTAYKTTCNIEIDFDEFYENLKLLYDNKTNTMIHIKIVDAALKENEKAEFYDKFSRVADRVFIESIVPLWKGMKNETISEESGLINKYGDSFAKQECCPLLFYTINVLPDGTIYPCSELIPPFKLGNIKSTTLLEAWNSKERKEFLENMLQNGRDNISICKDCYIPQNTVMTEGDSIDKYRYEILKRL
jgi:radical SAM protein with 4Fe4S-binding SPASM domain